MSGFCNIPANAYNIFNISVFIQLWRFGDGEKPVFSSGIRHPLLAEDGSFLFENFAIAFFADPGDIIRKKLHYFLVFNVFQAQTQKLGMGAIRGSIGEDI
ncbi:MAG: hypothetical protein R6V25_09710 [Desulfatiglandales bacterium]